MDISARRKEFFILVSFVYCNVFTQSYGNVFFLFTYFLCHVEMVFCLESKEDIERKVKRFQ